MYQHPQVREQFCPPLVIVDITVGGRYAVSVSSFDFHFGIHALISHISGRRLKEVKALLLR